MHTELTCTTQIISLAGDEHKSWHTTSWPGQVNFESSIVLQRPSFPIAGDETLLAEHTFSPTSTQWLAVFTA